MKYTALIFIIISLIAADDVAETQYVVHPHKSVRSLSFVIEDSLGKKAEAYKILDKNLNKNITGKTLFSVGVELSLQIQFLEYETIDCEIVVRPGLGVMSIKCDQLKKLRNQEFAMRKNYQVIDGVKYKYEFLTSNKAIESHLLTEQKKGSQTLYRVGVPRFASKVHVYCGFYYESYPATSRTTNIYKLKNVDMQKYIIHLRSIQKRGSGFIVNKVSRFVRSHKSYIKKSDHLDEFIDYLLSLDLSARASVQLENILSDLEGF